MRDMPMDAAARLVDHDTVWVDVAHDGLQPFDSRSDISCNVLWLRLRSVSLDLFNRQCNVHVLLVAEKI